MVLAQSPLSASLVPTAVVFGSGAALIAVALADLINTLVSTSTSSAKWWPSRFIGRKLFVVFRAAARRIPEERPAREALLSAFSPLLIIVLLATWAILQIVGFALIWNALDQSRTLGALTDDFYYSGVVYFTVGFGEIVPSSGILRTGALVEAFFGVITMAMVIGYIPSLYAAYSDRERLLMTLDAGGQERITPTALIKAWAPDADPKKLDAQFARWEEWAAGILETHSTVPLLTLFRSHDRRQNWVTALGLVADAALQAQLILGATDGYSFWFLRRAEAIFREVTRDVDLSAYETKISAQNNIEQVEALYASLAEHGFRLRPMHESVEYLRATRQSYAPAMEYLIDDLLCPRGFWPQASRVTAWSTSYSLPRHDAETTTAGRRSAEPRVHTKHEEA